MDYLEIVQEQYKKLNELKIQKQSEIKEINKELNPIAALLKANNKLETKRRKHG